MTTRGRILILNERDPRHPRAGGAEAHMWEIFGRLAARGYQVTAAASSFRGSPRHERVDGIDVRRLGPPGPSYLRAAVLTVLGTRRGEFDLAVECLNKLPFYAPLYSKVPVLAICHHLFGEAAFEQVAWPIAATVWLAERPIPWLYRQAAFLAISESSRDDLVRRGVAREQTRVIPCGIRRPSIVDPSEPSQRRPLVSYVGRLERYKRVDVVLRAVAALRERIPEIELVIVGTGTARASLEALASELGVAERTRFAGFVSDEERDAILAESRVCVCASIKEGWGLTVIEANAVGTPVVASDAPGLRDSVRDGRTGFLVPIDDVAAFTARIGELLSDDALADGMGREGEAWSQQFDWDEVADATEGIVRSLLDARGRAFVLPPEPSPESS